MPRGPDLGVLPSLHGVMYKHWIIKLHLSFPLRPAPLPGLIEASSLPSIELLSLSSRGDFFGVLCFVAVYCLQVSAIFPAVIAPRNGRLGTVNDGDKTFFHSEHSFRCISAQLSGWADFSPIDPLVFHSDVTTWIVCYRAFSAGSLHSGKHGWELVLEHLPTRTHPPTESLLPPKLSSDPLEPALQ